jgi:hypothetical protein
VRAGERSGVNGGLGCGRARRTGVVGAAESAAAADAPPPSRMPKREPIVLPMGKVVYVKARSRTVRRNSVTSESFTQTAEFTPQTVVATLSGHSHCVVTVSPTAHKCCSWCLQARAGGRTKRCPGCITRKVYYCNRECQMAHWTTAVKFGSKEWPCHSKLCEKAWRLEPEPELM